MIRKVIFICGLFSITTLSYAQYVGNCFKRYEIGFGYTLFQATGTEIKTSLTQGNTTLDSVPLSVNQYTPSAMLGFNFPIQLHNNFGLGVNVNLIVSAGG